MDKKIKYMQENISIQNSDEIVKEYYPLIYSYVLRRVGDQATSKDITQETFYRFFRNIHSYDHQGKMLNYLYRIAGNMIVDEKRHSSWVIDDYEIDTIVDQDSQPHHQVMKEIQKNKVQEMILELSQKDQTVLILRFYQELPFKDIADIMGMNVSTVKSRVKNAITHLSTKWKESEKDE